MNEDEMDQGSMHVAHAQAHTSENMTPGILMRSPLFMQDFISPSHQPHGEPEPPF